MLDAAPYKGQQRRFLHGHNARGIQRDRPIRSPTERFEKFVHETDACWLWTGELDGFGYGRIRESSGTTKHYFKAHRLAWEMAAGDPIPLGRHVFHTCDTPACVRNDEQGIYLVRGAPWPRWGHLFLGPKAVNNADRSQKGRTGYAGKKGESHHAARLTTSDVQAIRGLRQEAWSWEQLAGKFGVTSRTIRDVVEGRTWTHVR